jgi:hypothetical protein
MNSNAPCTQPPTRSGAINEPRWQPDERAAMFGLTSLLVVLALVGAVLAMVFL